MATRGQSYGDSNRPSVDAPVLWARDNYNEQGLVCNDVQFKDILNSNRVNLCEMLHLDDALWSELRRLDVISMNKEEDIKLNASNSEMVRRLIDHINRGPMWRMHAFLRACVITDNDYILDVLHVDSGPYEGTNLPSAPHRPDPPFDPGDFMETSSTITSLSSSSFSYQDDPEANRIRLKLLQPSTLLLDSLAKEITGVAIVFLQLLLQIQVINHSEVSQLQSIHGGQLRASYLVGVVSRKTGTQLKTFVDALRANCPSAYTVFATEGGRSSSPRKNTPESVPAYTNSNLKQASKQLFICVNNTHYGGFKIYSELKAVINSGINVTVMTFENGFNLLHEVIRSGQLDFIRLIQYAGIWCRLYSQKSGPEAGVYSNLTPLEYAEKLGVKGKAAKDKLTDINRHERQLQDVDRCVREGNVRKFRELKAKFKDRILTSSHKGKSVLEYACQSGVLEMLMEVIRAERELGMRRRSADKAIAVCVSLGHHTFLQPLMEYAKVDLNQIRLDGRTPIEYTAVNGDIDTFHVLQMLGAQAAPAVVALAAAKNRLPFLQSILSSRSLPSHNVNFQDKRGKTAAHFAAEKGHVKVLRLLLEKGLDLTLKDKRRFSILHSAATSGSLDVVEVVLEFCRRQDYLQTILTTRDHYLGADRCYCVKGNDGSNPAWHYVMVDRALIEVFKKKMAEGGINVTIYGTILRSGWGEGPSAEVVKEIEGQYDVVNVDASTLVDDMQPLHLAILKNHDGVALRLIREMRDVNQPDRFRLTPLHLAAMRGSLPVIKALMERGADVGAVDAKDRTPVDVAMDNEKQEAVQLLMPAGSDRHRENLRKKLKHAYLSLSRENLDDQEDPNQYTKSVLRNLGADIKDYLFDCLGEGPIDAASLDPL